MKGKSRNNNWKELLSIKAKKNESNIENTERNNAFSPKIF